MRLDAAHLEEIEKALQTGAADQQRWEAVAAQMERSMHVSISPFGQLLPPSAG